MINYKQLKLSSELCACGFIHSTTQVVKRLHVATKYLNKTNLKLSLTRV
jgi:hypothetical protein